MCEGRGQEQVRRARARAAAGAAAAALTRVVLLALEGLARCVFRAARAGAPRQRPTVAALGPRRAADQGRASRCAGGLVWGRGAGHYCEALLAAGGGPSARQPRRYPLAGADLRGRVCSRPPRPPGRRALLAVGALRAASRCAAAGGPGAGRGADGPAGRGGGAPGVHLRGTAAAPTVPGGSRGHV